MALQKVKESDMVVSVVDNKSKVVTKAKKILDEDTYTEEITKIIERDFYPDLPKLDAQAEYLEALEKNDLITLRKIQMKYGPSRPGTASSSQYLSPATFETPDPSQRNSSPKLKTKDGDVDPSAPPDLHPVNPEIEKSNIGTYLEVSESRRLGLDKFFSKNTSEDNAAFDEILRESDRKHRAKHAWLFNKEGEQMKEHEEKLALPSIEKQAILNVDKSSVDTWKYKSDNSLMYVPDGVELSEKEIIEDKKFKPREIVHENTRFQFTPYNLHKNKQIMQQAAVSKALVNQGKIGHDGKELSAGQTPRVNGYGFMATPSPAPGVEESPLMTWGEIEGTPLTLDTGLTPCNTSGPVFKIPIIPARDQLALDLAEKASKTHRAKKEAALKQVTRNLSSPSPKFSLSSTDRLNSLSPAAQRLASKKLGIRTHTDKALKDSYTPSPSHRLSGDKTPILRGTPTRTPKSVRSVMVASPKTPVTPKSTGTPKHSGADISSLTDNLLQLPKRAKASEFF
ncbi:splicing factor ESS-2 homolog [Patella vulgata]|uniref:splicing factor ESS-2 homolog n=1 Tax=Patella vulgata TaxID=6465 RepID=UPI00217F683D|nr:splicing factor ESS-2 homolog [Patella vulgata]